MRRGKESRFWGGELICTVPLSQMMQALMSPQAQGEFQIPAGTNHIVWLTGIEDPTGLATPTPQQGAFCP